MEELNINWLAIAIGAIAPMLVGFVWYHPKVVGGAWMKANGFEQKDLEGANMAVIFGVTLVLSFLLAFFMWVLLNVFHREPTNTFGHGMFHGMLMTIFMATPPLIINALFERRGFKYIAIHFFYWLISLMLMGGIVDAIS